MECCWLSLIYILNWFVLILYSQNNTLASGAQIYECQWFSSHHFLNIFIITRALKIKFFWLLVWLCYIRKYTRKCPETHWELVPIGDLIGTFLGTWILVLSFWPMSMLEVINYFVKCKDICFSFYIYRKFSYIYVNIYTHICNI